jgi:phosphotransferase system  glucose/maltose/N-acetylglucosamine-specific IIC component
MNPRVALKSGLKLSAMYSNSVLYLVDNSGKITRAQTAEEVNKQVVEIQGRQRFRSQSFARYCLFIMLFGAPALCLVVYLKQKKKPKQTIRTINE